MFDARTFKLFGILLALVGLAMGGYFLFRSDTEGGIIALASGGVGVVFFLVASWRERKGEG